MTKRGGIVNIRGAPASSKNHGQTSANNTSGVGFHRASGLFHLKKATAAG